MTENDTVNQFCGTDFWDNNLTWYTDTPRFTPCFEETVLAWFPSVILVVFLPSDIYLSINSKARNIPWNWRSLSKIVVCSINILSSVLDFIYPSKEFFVGKTIYPFEFCTPIIRALSVAACVSLILYHRLKGVRSSALLFLFWFFVVLFGIPQVFTAILRRTGEPIGWHDVTFLVYFFSSVVIFLLHFIADIDPLETDYPKTENPCPEIRASFPAKLFFTWFDSLAYLGYSRPLVSSDLWSLQYEVKAEQVFPAFDKNWRATLAKNAGKTVTVKDPSFDKKADGVSLTGSGKKTAKPSSILSALCKTFGPSFVLGSLLKLCQDLLAFVSPQVLKLLISFIEGDEPQWKGYFYASLLLITAALQTLFLAQYFNKMMLIGLHIRTALISTIYRKALRLSNAARKDSTVGEIVNLMSVDAQRFMDLTTYLNMVWSAPLQITLALYFLWQTLGPSVLAGLAVMIIMIPVNGVIANKMKTLQIKQMKNKDERVKMMNEILSGIKVLKLYAWEPSFEQQVIKIRNKEVKVLRESAYFGAATSFIWACAPFLVSSVTFAIYLFSDETRMLTASDCFVSITLFEMMRVPLNLLGLVIVECVEVSLVTFAVYVLVDENNVLDAKTAFVSLSLFNLLRFPLSMLPMMISNVIQASVSVKRINKFLNSEELDPDAVSHNEKEDDPIVIENGTFKWDSSEDVILKDINLRIKPNSLVAVVGVVGSGKSSLLSALMGEMEKISGRVNVKGKVAYVPQTAWIQNNTLQENILFGKPMHKKNYWKVIESCALKPDFDMLPGGDQTEIGEKGINLSGGQKQRVSLARAVYYDSDVYYLDDPLSAVDSHVGKHIFENVIGPKGLLHNKTRVFVTHGITYLHEVDLIVVLKDGAVSEMGTYKELLDKKGAFAEFLSTHISEIDKDELEELDEDLKKQILEGSPEKLVRQRSQNSESSNSLSRKHSGGSQKSLNELLSQKNKEKDKLIEEEKAEIGGVKWTVYKHYLSAIGPFLVGATIILNIIFQGFAIGSNLWLSVWSSDTSIMVNGTQDTAKRDMYLEVYGLLGAGQTAGILGIRLSSSAGAIKAAVGIHKLLLPNILKAPLSVFDTTPTGRILGRFSKDMDVVDSKMEETMSLFVWNLCLSVVAFELAELLGGVKASRVIHPYLLRRVLQAPLFFFETTPVGRILCRFSKDIDTVDNRIADLLGSVSWNGLKVVEMSFSGLGAAVVSMDLVHLLGGVKAAAEIHMFLLKGILKAPTSFFDTTPVGRILSRFSKDMNVIDVDMAEDMGLVCWNMLKTLDSQIVPSSSRHNAFLYEIPALFIFPPVLSVLVATTATYLGALKAAFILHNVILNGVLRAQMSFFDVTPLGRVLNRFAKDVDTMDSALPMTLRGWTTCFFSVIATVFVISYTTPSFVFVIIPVGFVYYFIQRFYVATSRQLKRLESVSRSPIYSHFGESVQGTSVLRAYNVQDRFIHESEEKVDFNQVCSYPGIIANRWLAVRLEMVGNLIIFFSAIFAVVGRDDMTAGLVGLSVSYALQITQTLNWLVRMTAEVETNIVAVERIKEYGEAPQEAPWEITPNIVQNDWPSEGKVEFKGYEVRYREGLDLVLRGISFTIDGGEKIGIVGRTGAGKSSMTLSLFRIIEAAGGCIQIDGVDISQLGLHALRSRLTIIPQDPVLFSGTLRMNLDPFEKYTDEQTWKALELAHLKSFVSGLPAKLQHQVSEGGDNLSLGQRQLICLARALLRKTKVLVLDEATAAVDLETDDLIQKTIRSEFAQCTVLTIAHRINTIMDSDRVLVLDKGVVVEFDPPDVLLKKKSSVFYGMAKDAGVVS